MPLGKVGRRIVSDETEAAILAWNKQRCKAQGLLAEKYSLENEIVRAQVLKKSELKKGLAAIADAIASRITSSDLSHAALRLADFTTKRELYKAMKQAENDFLFGTPDVGTMTIS
jgi:hypothetical protein